MPFSSGAFSLVSGNPVVTGTTISSTTTNNTFSDIATGLSTCLLKDGTQTATARIPFGSGISVTTDITTPSSTFSVGNGTATTFNLGGAATSMNIGASTGTTTISNATLALGASAVTSTQTTVALFNATATTLNIGGAATTVNLGAGAASTLTANFTTAVALNTAAITSTQTTVALLNATVTTLNFGGAATTLNIGNSSGTTTFVGKVLGTTFLGTPAATTSGTSVTLSDVPSGVTQVTINFNQVSTNGTSNPIIQIGPSGGAVNTGYVGLGLTAIAAGNNVTSYTTGFGIRSASASNVLQGSIILTRESAANNTWIASGCVTSSVTSEAYMVSGVISLSGPLIKITLTTVNGTDAFDAGEINWAAT